MISLAIIHSDLKKKFCKGDPYKKTETIKDSDKFPNWSDPIKDFTMKVIEKNLKVYKDVETKQIILDQNWDLSENEYNTAVSKLEKGLKILKSKKSGIILPLVNMKIFFREWILFTLFMFMEKIMLK